MPNVQEITLNSMGSIVKSAAFCLEWTAGRKHLYKEEETLFPLIKGYEQNPSSQLLSNIKNQIHTIENEHEPAGDIIKELGRSGMSTLYQPMYALIIT